MKQIMAILILGLSFAACGEKEENNERKLQNENAIEKSGIISSSPFRFVNNSSYSLGLKIAAKEAQLFEPGEYRYLEVQANEEYIVIKIAQMVETKARVIFHRKFRFDSDWTVALTAIDGENDKIRFRQDRIPNQSL